MTDIEFLLMNIFHIISQTYRSTEQYVKTRIWNP